MTDQITKFNKRYGKAKEDEKVIIETEMKNQTLEKSAVKIAKESNVSTEDIFAIITRNSMESFMNLWSNSIEEVVRKTIRTEIRQVIQEELVGAYTGIMKGMTEVKMEGIINDEINSIFNDKNPEPAIKFEEEKPKERINKKSYLDELEQAIRKANSEGINVILGKSFKSTSSRNSGMYQKFMRENKGIKGAWSTHVRNILKNK